MELSLMNDENNTTFVVCVCVCVVLFIKKKFAELNEKKEGIINGPLHSNGI
jgi:hypothetical protein